MEHDLQPGLREVFRARLQVPIRVFSGSGCIVRGCGVGSREVSSFPAMLNDFSKRVKRLSYFVDIPK